MKRFIAVLICLISMTAQAETVACESAKEFITTFEYLRDSSQLAGTADNAVKIASQVAQGCSGAAQRFIKTAKFLRKSEIPLQEIITTAVEFAQRDDANVEAFTKIFQRTYAQDGFDLDLNSSLKIAKEISVECNGNVKNALEDFEKVADFCTSNSEMPMTLTDCAQLAKRISMMGKEKGPSASEAFINSFKYLKGTVGITIPEARKISEEIVKTDPKAFENFKMSYEYALSDKGLKSSKDQALKFGKKMADLTVKETKNSSAN